MQDTNMFFYVVPIFLMALQFFRFPRAEGGGGTPVPMGKPILIALGPMGAAIVTKLVLKPHAEACCFGLFYSIVAIASLC